MAKRDASKVVQFWLDEIKASRKRHDKYRKTGEEILRIYEADQEELTPFNILFSNTETIKPALFSATPRPIVDRRHKDEDPLARLASHAGKRVLDFHLDTNRQGYESLVEALGSSVLDTCLTGRGNVAARYDADFVPLESPRPPDEHDEDMPTTPPADYADKEQVCYESIVWNRIHFGYAKKWTNVPWIAYEYFMTKEEVAGKFGKRIATELTYSAAQDSSEHGESHPKEGHEDETGTSRTALIYQIWDKVGGRKVRYLCESYPDGELLVEDDPLELTGFFNIPRPLMFIEKSWSLIPTAPYQTYKSQADELNRLTRRIKKITDAIKARGAYDQALGEMMKQVMQSPDNALVPVDVAASLATEKGFDKAVWMLPIETLIVVVQQLYQARDAAKQTIYEITGIADIMRGATNASETLGAQQIKNQWGTLRIKTKQAEVARYVRDLLRMTLEIAASRFSEETWAEMTGLPFLTTAQAQQVQAQVAAIGMGPPDQKLQLELAKPKWAEVLALLKNDLARSYRIDIETHSTVEPEAAEDQKAISDLLMSMGQSMQAFGPLVQQGVLPFEAAQAMLLFIVRRFRFGTEIEDKIQAMQAPKPPEQDKSKEADLQQKALEMETSLAVKEVEHKKKESEMSIKDQTMKAEAHHAQREMDLQVREMKLSLKEQHVAMREQVNTHLFELDKGRASEELGNQKKMADLQNTKFKTENVVNSKADSALGQGVNAMKGLVQQLADMMAKQAQDNQQMLATIIELQSKPRMKKIIRDKDGRPQALEETVA